MADHRTLPARRNPLLQEEHTPPVEILIERRALGSTVLEAENGTLGIANATMPKNLGRFDYLHLKVPLPKDLTGSDVFPPGPTKLPEGYYLMRRSSDGWISVTGMLKASFPWASHAEIEAEKQHHAASGSTDEDEIAGNLWATPEFALELAGEYGISDWIVALLDPHPIHNANPNIAIPPRFEVPRSKPKTNGNMSTRRTASRDLRSASPVKQAAPTANKPKATPRKRKAKKPAATPEVADSAAEDDDDEKVNGIPEEDEEAAKELAEAVAAADDDDDEPLGDGTVRVSITEDKTVDDEDNEVTRTSVRVELPADSEELELPKDTEGVIEMAHEVIENAKNIQEGTTEASASPSSNKKSLKRKADTVDDDTDLQGPEEIIQEVAEGEATELANGEVDMHGRPTKRTRVMVPAEEYRKEKLRRRALMGLSGALAVGVMIPFLQNLL